MMCKFFCVIFLCGILFTGCGISDKALVLTGEDLTERYGESKSLDEIDSKEENAAAFSGQDERAEASEKVEEQRILVYVCGAVVNPGVVELPADSRAADALEAAGGFLEEAQPDYVNLAARLEDAQKLYFPTREETQKLVQEEVSAAEGLININTAGAEQLCTLPGIGEARAKDIISYRQEYGAFGSEEDIMKVPGIKQSAYEKLKGKITVR